MFRIWFERPMPSVYQDMLDGIAEAVGPGEAGADWPPPSLISADGVIASARARYDGAMMDKTPSLRVISRTGIGVDNISLPDATARGIVICNLPDVPSISTAEHAITLIMATAKHIKRSEHALRIGGKQDYFGNFQGMELDGRRLGLVGLGRIGSRVARMANAIGMKVTAYDPIVSAERAAELNVELAPSLEALLKESDVVSLHIPSSPDTHHLINGKTLAMMKPGAYLVNTARGALVDEKALLSALESGYLGGVGLDVFDPEPPAPENPLLHRDDVIATPHIAGATLAGKDRLWRNAITQAIQVLRGERPPNVANPDVWAKRKNA